jgi:hypothetical protein
LLAGQIVRQSVSGHRFTPDAPAHALMAMFGPRLSKINAQAREAA